MFRFTIRELLILTVTVALAVGWWVDHRQLWNDRERTQTVIAQYEAYDLDQVLKLYNITAAQGLRQMDRKRFIREALDYYEKRTP